MQTRLRKDNRWADILHQAIIFSLIIIRAAQGRKYPKAQSTLLGTLQFVRRTHVATTATQEAYTRDDTSEIRVDLESGSAEYPQSGSGTSVVEKRSEKV